MAQEPRDLATYIDDLIRSKNLIDPALDLQKGPLSVMAWMFANEGVRTEGLAGYLRRLYQFTDPGQIDDEDMFQIALNFGKDPNIAQTSQVTIHFYRQTRPEANTGYTISEGTIASTSDGRFNFVTVESASMNGSIADSYYNATRGWYGLPVRCEAVAVGADYDLPPETINTIITVQEQFDGCINLDYARRGTDPVAKEQLRDIIWAAQQGLDRDIAGYYQSLVDDINPTGYDAFALVSSTDTSYFKRYGRIQGKIGYDQYMITTSLDEDIQEGIAHGGETSFLLDRRPVATVVSVLVDGATVGFALDVDRDPRIERSPRADDRVLLSIALAPGQAYEIRYLYYDTVYEMQVLMAGRSTPFGTDSLTRLAAQRPVHIAGTFKSTTTANRETVEADIIGYAEAYLRNPDNTESNRATFVASLDPSAFQREVEASIDGLIQFRLTRFARIDNATMPIERIFFDGNTEYPVLDPSVDIS